MSYKDVATMINMCGINLELASKEVDLIVHEHGIAPVVVKTLTYGDRRIYEVDRPRKYSGTYQQKYWVAASHGKPVFNLQALRKKKPVRLSGINSR